MIKKTKTSSKTTIRYRDAGTGHFMTEQQAKRRKPENIIRERVPKPGFGDTK